jgi:hypothetical protein
MQTQTEEQEFHSNPGLLTTTRPELCQVSDTAGNYDYLSRHFAQILQLESVGDGIIRFNPEQMKQDEPYPFRLSDSWFIAIKRQEGHIDFLFVQ